MIKHIRTLIIVFILLIISFLYFLNYYPGTETVIHNNRHQHLPVIDSESLPALKIMTYNINFGLYADKKNNLGKIADIINSSGATIIALNEVDHRRLRTDFVRQIVYLADQLEMNYVYGPGLKTGIGSQGNALLSKYPVLKSNNIRLPQQLLEEPRSLLYSQLLLPGKVILHVFVTHLATNASLRQKQLMKIEEITADIDGHLILMGDFNQHLTKIGSLIPAATQKIATFPENKPVHAIDLIFTSRHFTGHETTIMEIDASDHMPLISTLIPVNPPVHAATPG